MEILDPWDEAPAEEKTVYLVTNKDSYNHFNKQKNIKVITELEGKEIIKAWYETTNLVGLDTECNGLDPLINDVLLLGIGDTNTVFILDVISLNNIDSFIANNVTYIAHNAKYDYTILNRSCNIVINDWYCTMIADQKIWQGCGITPTNFKGYSFTLSAILERRFKKAGIELDKDVRMEFVGQSATNYKIKLSHINYLVEDIEYLIPIYNSQRKDIEKYDLSFYIDNIGRHQIWSVGDMELTGFYIDTEEWLLIIKENEEKKFNTELALDTEFRRLRDTLLTKEERQYLVAGNFDTLRKKQKVAQTSLFDNSPSIKEVGAANCINWGSDDQLKNILGRLKLEIPTKTGRIRYKVPTFYKKHLAKDIKFVLDDRNIKYTTNKDALESMLIDLPNYKGKELLKLLIEHRKVTKALETYGENFLKKVSNVTGLIHTQYRTDTAKTGRYQSGGGKSLPDKINVQNLPKEKRVRQCFRGGPDEYVATHDLSGAEVTLVCDFAHDEQLYEWAVINDDSHSPIAQATWRDIYWYRAGVYSGLWFSPDDFFHLQHSDYAKTIIQANTQSNSEIKHFWDLAQNLIINKEVNSKMRGEFKPMTFGTIYQMKAKKAGQTLNISKDEGAVGIQSIRNAIPNTFKYVDANIEKSFKQGYLVLNTRTNSRIWFPELIRCYRNNEQPNWKLQADVSGSAANAPFQGTQADMLKESIVEMSFAIKAYNWKATIPGMVHDELVSRFNKKLNEKNTVIWFSDKYKKQYHSEQPLQKAVPLPKPNETKFLKALDSGDAILCNYPEFKKHTMQEVANRYLTHYKMKCDYDVLETWTK